ncbi:MAG: prephenate dehydrogenase/arogenate dehydrogenase family protein [Planctomycetota bacterium]
MPDSPATPEFGRLVVVGVGLIGGSIALAARRAGAYEEVIGVARRPESRQRALDAGVVAHATTDMAAAVATADTVVICAPVGAIAGTALAVARACPPGCLLTDAGSTKAGIVEAIEHAIAAEQLPVAFVGSHPIAGDHRTGPEAAREDLFDGRSIVVTPTPATPPDATLRATRFWRSLGGETLSLSPAEHDRLLALTSHLPHVAAAALAGVTPAEALPLTGGGWQDTTRVAAGDPALWRDILLANRADVMAALDTLQGGLTAFRQAVSDEDPTKLLHLLAEGKDRRDAVGD